jgi:hypothetical protein
MPPFIPLTNCLRYRQDKITKNLEIQLQSVEAVNVVTQSVEASDFALIEGVGNETYLNENMAGHILELEKSKLSMHPIEIQVK